MEAGTSAHLLNNDEASLSYFDTAETAASKEEDVRAALWGQFLATEWLKREDEAAEALAALARVSGSTVDELLRIATGQLRAAMWSGEVHKALARADELLHVADRSRDPLIRSSFLNSHAFFLSFLGQYDRALIASRALVDYIRTTDLDFGLPYAYFCMALAQLGLRQFRATYLSLVQCRKAQNSDFVTCNIETGYARLHLATHQFADALETLGRVYPIAERCPPAHAECLAWWSLAHAMTGNARESASRAEQAESLSKRVDVSALVSWTRAILASDGRFGRRTAMTAFRGSIETGNIDAFVTAYRTQPRLLELLLKDETRETLRSIMTQANDHDIARKIGITLPAPNGLSSPSGLSRREGEVLDLVSKGLLNKQIAQTLFISEATVKVHVRRICQKLGVRTRTEAAMRAAELND